MPKTHLSQRRYRTRQYPPPTRASRNEDTPMSGVRLIQEIGTSLTRSPSAAAAARLGVDGEAGLARAGAARPPLAASASGCSSGRGSGAAKRTRASSVEAAVGDDLLETGNSAARCGARNGCRRRRRSPWRRRRTGPASRAAGAGSRSPSTARTGRSRRDSRRRWRGRRRSAACGTPA